ncbi:MAG: glutamyl-tRNA reductase [Calditrichaeota bacterium]|nr:glutamyl-tRNA reductase [Calditrichota bacterium]
MTLVVVGVNYRTAGFDGLARLSLSKDKIDSAYESLLSRQEIKETTILSTCNRTEVYAVVSPREAGLETLFDFFASLSGLNRAELEAKLFHASSNRAARHLFRVTCGLDSYMLGETQIAGQVKDAYREAVAHRATGPILNRLFHKAFRVNKRVRNETQLQHRATSLAEACVELARKIFHPFAERKALVLGAGETARLAAEALQSGRIGGLAIANRTLSRAEALAGEFAAEALRLKEAPARLAEFDIVVGATASTEPVLTREHVERALHVRNGQPLVLLDLAVPPDFDPEMQQLEGVYHYSLADLKSIVEENRKQREVHVAQAERIIDEEVEDYFGWLKSAQIGPTIRDLRERIEQIRRSELERYQHRLHESDRELVELITTRIINKVLHLPTVRLREIAKSDDGWYKVEAIRDLFGLTENA